MRLATATRVFVASVCISSVNPVLANTLKQAWFYHDSASQHWCSVVSDADSKAASKDERFDWHETGWLRYHRSKIDSIMIMLQSEDAYEEDTYTFDPDLRVRQLVRRGHYG